MRKFTSEHVATVAMQYREYVHKHKFGPDEATRQDHNRRAREREEHPMQVALKDAPWRRNKEKPHARRH